MNTSRASCAPGAPPGGTFTLVTRTKILVIPALIIRKNSIALFGYCIAPNICTLQSVVF